MRINNTVCKDSEIIEREVISYFNTLFNGFHDKNLQNTGVSFKADDTHVDYLTRRLNFLSDEDRDDLVKPMTLDELEQIVKACKKNKSPGLDGICYEFYQVTFEIIKEDLLQVLQCQLNEKQLVKSNREVVEVNVPTDIMFTKSP